MVASPSEKTALPQIGAVKHPRLETALESADGDWLCAGCLNRIASEEDRFQYDGKSEFSFSNPDGLQFDIITFSQTVGGQEVGTPTLEHTWFPGHAWSFCVCDRCQTHLGWFYSGPQEFVGLIRNRLVRGRSIWN